MNSDTARAIPESAEIQTPALLVDLDAMEQNLRTMAAYFSTQSSKLRPHFKNHRVLEIAQCQLKHGAAGITCARLWQAEKLVQAGIQNVLIANEVAGAEQIRRFAELSGEAPVIVAVDNESVVREMGRRARDRRVELNVVVDIDLGLKRCGVAPGEPAVALAKFATEQGLRFRGIMGYEGHLQPMPAGPEKTKAVTAAMQALVSTKQQIEAAGIAVEIVSCGGTGDYSISASYPGVTENQAGSYLLMDSWYAPLRSRLPADAERAGNGDQQDSGRTNRGGCGGEGNQWRTRTSFGEGCFRACGSRRCTPNMRPSRFWIRPSR